MLFARVLFMLSELHCTTKCNCSGVIDYIKIFIKHLLCVGQFLDKLQQWVTSLL